MTPAEQLAQALAAAPKGPAKRAKKPRPAACFAPFDAVILNVDTAEGSGFAITVRGKLWQWGEVNMLYDAEFGIAGNVCRDVWAKAHLEVLPAVLVFERPFRGTTQGQWIGAWKREWVGAGLSKGRMLGVYPATWRARVLGSASLPRPTARRREMLIAQQLTGEQRIGPDAAAAIAISEWSKRAGEVAARLPKHRAAKTQTQSSQPKRVREAKPRRTRGETLAAKNQRPPRANSRVQEKCRPSD